MKRELKWLKKTLAIMLAVCMITSLMSATVFADSTSGDSVVEANSHIETVNGEEYAVTDWKDASEAMILGQNHTATAYDTLSAAIKSAQEGDVIQILADSIEIPKFGDKKITIQGKVDPDGVPTTAVTSFLNTSSNGSIGVTYKNLLFNVQVSFYGNNTTFDHCKFAGTNAGTNAIANSVLVGNVVFNYCDFAPTGDYAFSFKKNSTGGSITVSHCTIKGAIKTVNDANLPNAIDRISFDNCNFIGKSETGKFNITLYCDASFTKCDFAQVYNTSGGIQMYARDYSLTSETTPTQKISVTMDGCTVDKETGTLVGVVKKGSNLPQGICAIDATKDGQNKYTSGTFVYDDKTAFDALVATYCKTVEVNEFVSTVERKSVAKIGETEYYTFSEAVTAATVADSSKEARTIELLADVAVDDTVNIIGESGTGRIYIVGDHSLTIGENAHVKADFVTFDCDLVVKGDIGTTDSANLYSTAPILYHGDVTVTGNIECDNYGAFGYGANEEGGKDTTITVTGAIKGGTYCARTTVSAGGGFEATDTYRAIINEGAKVQNSTIKDALVNTAKENLSNVLFQSGQYQFDPEGMVAEGYKSVKIDNTTWSVIPSSDAAEYAIQVTNGDEEYCIKEFPTSLVDGCKYKLIGIPVENTSKMQIPKNATVEIDLNGYTFTKNDNYIKTLEGATLTLKDTSGSGNGKIVTANLTYVIQNNGKLVLESGGIVGDKTAIKNSENGNIDISGGYVYAPNTLIYDLNTNTQDNHISITGGTFSQDPSKFLADDYGISKSGDVWTVGEAVALIVGYNTKYSSLAYAINTRNTNKTVKVLADTTVDEVISLTSGKEITLDLNGKTVTTTVGKTFTIDASGDNKGSTLIVKNGSIVGPDSTDASCPEGMFYVIGTPYSAAIGEANVIIESDVTITGGRRNFWIDNTGTVSYKTQIDFAGKIYAYEAFYVSSDIKATNGNIPQINITSTAVVANNKADNSDEYQGNYIGGYAKVTVDDGATLTTDNGNVITMAAGELVANGGTWTAGTTLGSGTSIYEGAASAVYVQQHTTNLPVYVKINNGIFKGAVPVNQVTGKNGASAQPEKVMLAIKGGTFTSTYTGSKEVNVVHSADKTGFIEGGTYSAEPKADYLAIDYVVDMSSTTAYTVVASSHKVAIGSEEYSTLAAAVDAVKNGETIKLLSDYNISADNEDFIINTDKKFTIDLNGKTLVGAVNLCHGDVTFKNGTISYLEGQPLTVYGSINPSVTNYSTLTVNNDVTVNGMYGISVACTSDDATYGVTVNMNGTYNVGNGLLVSGKIGMNQEETAENLEAMTNSNVINVTGTLNCSEVAIALHGQATVNINEGANITGTTGIGVKRGVLNVNDGSITATGEKGLLIGNRNGAEDTGAAISITSTYNEAGSMTVNIKDGTITSNHNAAVYVEHTVNTKTSANYPFAKGYDLVITGGKFKGIDTAVIYVCDEIDGDKGSCQNFISGGYFSTKPTDNYVGNGLKVVDVPKTCNEYKEGYIYAIGVASNNTVTVVLNHATESSPTGSLSGGGTFNANSYVTVEAEEVANAQFIGWYSDAAATNKLSGNRKYSFYASTDTTLYAKYGAITGEGKLKVADGSATVKYNGNILEAEATIANGTTVTLTSTGSGTFYGWYDGNGHKIGGDATLTFIMNGDKTVKAVYNTADSTHAFVQFETNISAASEGKYKDSYLGGYQMNFSTDSDKNTSVSNAVGAQPTVPSYVGYEFNGYKVIIGGNTYDVDADENGLVNTTQLGNIIKNANSNETVTIVANYKRSQTTYHIRLHFVECDENNTPIVNAKVLDGTYTVGEAVMVWADSTITKSETSYALAGFKFNGQTFNGAESVTIWPTESQIGESGNVEVFAMYSEGETTASASVNIINAYAETENGVNKTAVTMSYSVPENCTVVENGFYVGLTDACTKKNVSTLKSNNGVYTLHAKVAENVSTSVYFKAFVTYKDADGTVCTIYSSVNNYTWNGLSGVTE